MEQRRITYVWENKLIEYCDKLPAVLGRASMVHDLISAYNILNHIKVVRSTAATFEDLKLFHSELYLEHLKTFTDVEEDYMPTQKDEEYGFGYDCAPVSDMYNIISNIAGSSVTAAKCLLLGIADVSINWCGGWHHANKSRAEGFCYVNDVVIAIEKLKLKFSKVLYIDLDVHHGNGVQDAYNLNSTIFTLSFHKYEPGFYPGTGSVNDIGASDARGYTCNFPFQAFYSDKTFTYAVGINVRLYDDIAVLASNRSSAVYAVKKIKSLTDETTDNVFSEVNSHFKPDVIVVQCGADALSRDPNGGAGLTIKGYCICIKNILKIQKPVLLLGGGGYNHSNTAKLWTAITAQVAGITLDENIPEHTFWSEYGPDYTLTVEPLLARDLNTKSHIDTTISTIKDNLNKYFKRYDSQDIVNKKRRLELIGLPSYMLKCSADNKNNGNNNTEEKPIDVYEFFE